MNPTARVSLLNRIFVKLSAVRCTVRKSTVRTAV